MVQRRPWKGSQMNDTHGFAKVVLAGIGIFFGIQIIAQMLIPIAWPFTAGEFSAKSLCFIIVWLAVSGLCLVVVCYIFLYRREELAHRIVGKQQPRQPQSQIEWLPTAFHLICIFAGLYCLFTTSSRILHTVLVYFFYYNRAPVHTTNVLSAEHVLNWLPTLTAGVYLLCGAPHFVRWQLRKTLQQCKGLDKSDNNNL